MIPDFNDFWTELRNDVARCDPDWERKHRTQIVRQHGKAFRIDWLRFSTLEDTVAEAWIAVPDDHPNRRIGFLWLPGYSYGTPPPDETNLVTGCVCLGLNVMGNAPDTPYKNPAGKDDYILNGIESPRSYIYRSIVGHCLRAANVLKKQDDVDSDRVVVAGMSQGGGLALLVAAQDPTMRLCLADMPFLADLSNALQLSRSGAYLTFNKYLTAHPDRAEQAYETLRLFDPVRHAPAIHVPTWLCAGGKDPAVKPSTVKAVYEALGTSDKEYRLFPADGHVFKREMNETYHKWIDQYLEG